MKNNSLSILLLNPALNTEDYKSYVTSRRIEEGVGNQESPHIGFGYILAVARQKKVEARYIDMGLEDFSISKLLDLIEDEQPLLVGFTAFTVQINAAAVIAGQIKLRFPNQRVCVGGAHATSVPLETLKEFPSFDFVVCGEAENSIFEALSRIALGQKVENINGIIPQGANKVTRTTIEHLDPLPFPLWEAFDLKKYPGMYQHHMALELPMVTSRGCPFQCIFCVGRTFREKRSIRSVDSVLQEIENNIQMFGCQSIAFLDETLILKVSWAKELFQKMIDRGISKSINWSCSTRVSDISPEMLNLMKRAGCYYIFWDL